MRLGFEPLGWDLSLEAEIGLRLGLKGGGTLKKKIKEKFPLCESIGHWPLRGLCPKRGI